MEAVGFFLLSGGFVLGQHLGQKLSDVSVDNVAFFPGETMQKLFLAVKVQQRSCSFLVLGEALFNHLVYPPPTAKQRYTRAQKEVFFTERGMRLGKVTGRTSMKNGLRDSQYAAIIPSVFVIEPLVEVHNENKPQQKNASSDQERNATVPAV